jgi:uncharacterized membrane protein YfcA
MFEFLLITGSVVAGIVASISGFGIGSILTPLVSAKIDTKVAVAVVSIPHFVGTLIRFIRLRQHVSRSLALTFGAASAIGGLTGALLQAYASGPTLAYIFGSLLVLAGLSGLSGFAERMELKGPWRWIGGFASAGFGGLVGNQGGIRSAAMLGFNLSKEAFVATATAIAIVVDAARMPIYLIREHDAIAQAWPIIIAGTVGVVIGTFLGFSLLHRISENAFKRVVSLLVFGLGVYMLLQAS